MAEMSAYTFMVNMFRQIISPDFSIDDFCFRLHHHYTVRMLTITVFLSFLYKVLDPISCFTLSKDLPDKVLNSYCLMQNTYTLPDAMDKQIGSEVVFQGVDNAFPDTPKEYQRYYQWVPVVLLAQAMLFKLPYYLWETKERNNIEGLILDMNKPLPVSAGHVDMLAKHLMDTRKKYRRIASWYLACSFLNLTNVVVQLVFTNMFLGGELLENGWFLLGRVNANYNQRTDRMVTIFPRMTKCTFNQFGVGGDVQHYDAMCVMPFNFFYEWIFVFNITWFVFVAAMTLWYVLCYLGSFASHRVQFFLLSFPCLWRYSRDLQSVLGQLDFGHRFVLIMLRSRLSMVHFEMLVDKLETMLGQPEDDEQNVSRIAFAPGPKSEQEQLLNSA